MADPDPAVHVLPLCRARLVFTLKLIFDRPPPRPPVPDVVIDALQDEGRELRLELRNAWPIKTGKSRAGFDYVQTSAGYVVQNSVRYTGFIERRGAVLADTLIPDLLEQTANETAQRLAAELPSAILDEVL